MAGVFAFAAGEGWGNPQITKNCGMLLYLFHKLYGDRAVMVGGDENVSYTSLAEVSGVEMVCLPNPKKEACVDYIRKHSDEIDLLILHGTFAFFYPLVEIYKRLRPDGKVYLETDANSHWIDRIPITEEFCHFLSQCDVVGASCRKIQRWLGVKWPHRIDYIPNGFYDFQGVYREPDFAQKEDLIITVGRLGTRQKRSEDLLEAFALVADKFPTWKLALIGNQTSEFIVWVKNFLAANPFLQGRVIMPGMITEKKELYEWYRRAKIFALTSALEGGTPNVIAEALYAGDYIVTSDIDGAGDATDSGRCGMVYPCGDIAALADCFGRLLSSPKLLVAGGAHAIEHGKQNFDFEKLARRLRYLLYGDGTMILKLDCDERRIFLNVNEQRKVILLDTSDHCMNHSTCSFFQEFDRSGYGTITEPRPLLQAIDPLLKKIFSGCYELNTVILLLMMLQKLLYVPAVRDVLYVGGQAGDEFCEVATELFGYLPSVTDNGMERPAERPSKRVIAVPEVMVDDVKWEVGSAIAGGLLASPLPPFIGEMLVLDLQKLLDRQGIGADIREDDVSAILENIFSAVCMDSPCVVICHRMYAEAVAAYMRDVKIDDLYGGCAAVTGFAKGMYIQAEEDGSLNVPPREQQRQMVRQKVNEVAGLFESWLQQERGARERYFAQVMQAVQDLNELLQRNRGAILAPGLFFEAASLLETLIDMKLEN